MPKTITLRLDDATYEIFHALAVSDNRPLSNLIETAARRHLEECLFADETEMRSIRGNVALVKRLKQASKEAKFLKGRFVE